MTTIHWIFDDKLIIELIDDFIYDHENKPIVPNDNFKWIDIYGIEHIMEPRDGLPPLVKIINNTINYYW